MGGRVGGDEWKKKLNKKYGEREITKNHHYTTTATTTPLHRQPIPPIAPLRHDPVIQARRWKPVGPFDVLAL